MIQTRFLGTHEYELYRAWLQEQDSATLRNYFGISVSSETINRLVEKICANPEQHHFLVGIIGNEWAGVLHIAEMSSSDLEFGVIVNPQYQGRGVADQLIHEAITWARNRNFERLYLHCLNRNTVMRHLAEKHGLVLEEINGDVEANVKLSPPSFFSYVQEANNLQKNIFYANFKKTWFPFSELHG